MINRKKNPLSLVNSHHWFCCVRIVFLLAAICLTTACRDSEKANIRIPDELTFKEVSPNIAWVKIKPGMFIFGSPEDTPCRASIAEAEVTVKLTRSFLIADSEITQQQWEALDLQNPSKNLGDNLPVTFVNFYEALVWCNKLSKLEGLDTCYDLSSCHNDFGSGCNTGAPGDYHSCWDESKNFMCSLDTHRYSDIYSCPGYRLPTSPEWEYAAKAGTTSHTYGGEVTPVSLGFCEQDTSLDDIAWYCYNSNDELHPAKQKLPNPWGLYDTLGNTYEWTDYFFRGQSLGDGIWDPDELLIDPIGPETGDMKDVRGGVFSKTGCYLRPSRPFSHEPLTRAHHTGFRPVRTLFE